MRCGFRLRPLALSDVLDGADERSIGTTYREGLDPNLTQRAVLPDDQELLVKSAGMRGFFEFCQNRKAIFRITKTLAEIDAVFVTIEPKGGSARPTGKQLLFAYLKADSNHP